MNASLSQAFLSLARRLGFVVILLAVASLGCSKGNKNKGSSLSGKVAVKGELLKGGQMRFQPVAGGVIYPASITNQGTYSVSGLPQGEMKVAVDTEMIKSTKYAAPPGVKAPDVSSGQEYVAVPEKYRSPDNTPLRVTISGKNQEQNFDLEP
jgi:hypothetical protein